MPFAIDKSGALKTPSAEELAEADKTSCIITLLQAALADHTPYWAYIGVLPSKYQEFQRRVKAKQPMDLEQFGTIYRYGFDAEVPSSIEEEMRAQYNLQDGFLDQLVTKAKDEQKKVMDQNEDQRIGDIVAMLKKRQGG